MLSQPRMMDLQYTKCDTFFDLLFLTDFNDGDAMNPCSAEKNTIQYLFYKYYFPNFLLLKELQLFKTVYGQFTFLTV